MHLGEGVLRREVPNRFRGAQAFCNYARCLLKARHTGRELHSPIDHLEAALNLEHQDAKAPHVR